MSEPSYIVRRSVSTGLNNVPKFGWSILGVISALERLKTEKKSDYFFVFLLSGSIISYLEHKLTQLKNPVRMGTIVKNKNLPKLFNFKISPKIVTILRGFSEGGAFTLLPLIICDITIKLKQNKNNEKNKSKNGKINKKQCLVVLLMLLILFGVTIHSSDLLFYNKRKTVRISSIRRLYTKPNNIYLSYLVLIIFYCIISMENNSDSLRVYYSFIVQIIISLLYNFIAYLFNVRFIINNKKTLEKTGFKQQLFGLFLYDAILEIAGPSAAYIAVYFKLKEWVKKIMRIK